ncbi:MAG: porin [Burkholderiales bacterium]|nr:porin [Burkholderiales bacterium]
MHKVAKALLLAGASALPFLSTATRAQDTPVHTFTGKVAGYTEYEYRGISQTSEKPAVQLNLDYAHASGFYVGTFVSNIKWLKDVAEVSNTSTNAQIEWDIYGGFKMPVGPVTLDLGYLRYEYPSSGVFDTIPGWVKPNTDEVYLGASFGPATLKYSYSLGDTFGVPNSKGSDYIELAVNYAIPSLEKLTINGILGHQKYKNNGAYDYTVYKLGATWDFGGGLTAGGYYKDTNADGPLYTYLGRDWSRGRAVAFVAYSF